MVQNVEIRLAAKRAGVKLWQIADELGMNDGNFSRKLRFELPDADKEMILCLINEIARGERHAQDKADS